MYQDFTLPRSMQIEVHFQIFDKVAEVHNIFLLEYDL